MAIDRVVVVGRRKDLRVVAVEAPRVAVHDVDDLLAVLQRP